MSGIDIKEILLNLGIEHLTVMQQTFIEESKKEHDIVLLSPTGSGKTLAYLIPLVQGLSEGGALVLVPSRELALQIEQVFKAMRTGVPVMSCYGGRPAMDEHRVMKGLNPRVVIGTPGRINDHLSKGNLEASEIRTLVIDEFDKCLEFGFQDEMSQVIGRLPSLSRRYLLSATDAPSIPDFVSNKNFLKLNFLNADAQKREQLDFHVVRSAEKDKLDTLFRLLCQLGDAKSLIFVNYRESVERVYGYLHKKGVACGMLHGGMEQKDRERALYKFANGSSNVFISTDLASRGLDISSIDNVIHYHLPLNEEAYIHRNGRTARWDAEGHVFIILGPEEWLPDYAQQLSTDYELQDKPPVPSAPQWVTLYIGKGKRDKINKVDIMGFLTKVGGLGREDVGRIDVKEHYAFVAIRRGMLDRTLAAVKGQKIKGIKTIVEKLK